jgi:hypothetical protein
MTPRRNSSGIIFFEGMPREASRSAPRIFPARDCHLERRNQPRPGGAEFVAVRHRKFREQLFAARRHNELYLAPIGAVARAPNPTMSFQTPTQLHGAVVADLEPLGQNAHRRFESERTPFDGQESLMLLWLDPGRSRGARAEIQEAANFIAEVGERFVVNVS